MPMLARDLNRPDCWIAAGFVRCLVWGHLHQRNPSARPDLAWREIWPELTFSRSDKVLGDWPRFQT